MRNTASHRKPPTYSYNAQPVISPPPEYCTTDSAIHVCHVSPKRKWKDQYKNRTISAHPSSSLTPAIPPPPSTAPSPPIRPPPSPVPSPTTLNRTMPTSAPALVTPPHILIIDGFVIETYPSISQTPYATLPTPPPNPPPPIPRCLLCLRLPTPADPLLPCSNCPRIYHQACLTPLLRPHLPSKRPFLCPPCSQTTIHAHHLRATAVASLRRFHQHLASFPSLPPKLSLKALNLPPPTVNPLQVPTTTAPPLPLRLRPPATLPPKRRLPSRQHDHHLHQLAPQPSTLFKRVSRASVALRRRSIASLNRDLRAVVVRRNQPDLLSTIRHAKDHLRRASAVPMDDHYIKAVHSDPPDSVLPAETHPLGRLS